MNEIENEFQQVNDSEFDRKIVFIENQLFVNRYQITILIKRERERDNDDHSVFSDGWMVSMS